MTDKKYNIHVSDRILTWNEEEEAMEWMEESGKNDKKVESHNTLKECFESMENWGSRWVMYPSVYIETEEDGEIWECTAECSKCSKCGHEEWNNTTSQSALIGKSYKEFEEAVKNGL